MRPWQLSSCNSLKIDDEWPLLCQKDHQVCSLLADVDTERIQPLKFLMSGVLSVSYDMLSECCLPGCHIERI